ncbi:MAG: hypothetical protein K5885_03560 [Bacteroidales bacterium]|nr:hypothetical protein [Bacteroidales bacterium]
MREESSGHCEKQRSKDNSPSTIEGEFARTGTACRSQKWCANESVGIANSKVWAAKAFF